MLLNSGIMYFLRSFYTIKHIIIRLIICFRASRTWVSEDQISEVGVEAKE